MKFVATRAVVAVVASLGACLHGEDVFPGIPFFREAAKVTFFTAAIFLMAGAIVFKNGSAYMRSVNIVRGREFADENILVAEDALLVGKRSADWRPVSVLRMAIKAV